MRSRDLVPAANMAAEELPSDFDIVILGTGLAESVVAAACSRVGQRVLHLDRRSHYAANWASFTFNGLLTWIEEQKEESKPEKIEDWSSLVEEGEGLIHLSNSDPASITNLQVFSYTSEEEEADEPNTIEEEKAAGEDAVKESSETESAGSKEEEDAGPAEEEEPAETEEEEPEADQPPASPPSSQSEPIRKKISHTQLVKEGRRFNIDLVSKLLFSRGTLVDLLIKSNVSRYAEFKNVTRILTYRHGNIEQVPCSRADVFASRQLSVVEKRKLMRFLTSCMEETEEQTAYNGRPYSEFLRDQQLGESLQHFLLHSIAMVTEDTPTEEGLASTRHFLRCLGRYGNTAFLFPVYGLGEIPQCFCRMSAVFGGIYCLRHSVHCLIVDKDTNRCKAVIDSRGQRISCSHVVLEDSYLDADRKQTATPPRYLSRAVLITDASVLPSDPDQQISMVTVPPATTGGPSVKMVELSSSTMTCIPGTYLVHLTCQSVASAHEDLSPLVTRIFRTTEPQDEDRRPSVLWCLYFNMADGSALEVEGHRVPSNVYVCSGPDGALGHEHTIRQAESIFQKILPEEEFCPPAPNPEDIIYDGDNASPGEDRAAVENGGNQEENQEMEGNQEENQEMEGNQEEIQEKEGNQENQEENGVNQEPEE